MKLKRLIGWAATCPKCSHAFSFVDVNLKCNNCGGPAYISKDENDGDTYIECGRKCGGGAVLTCPKCGTIVQDRFIKEKGGCLSKIADIFKLVVWVIVIIIIIVVVRACMK